MNKQFLRRGYLTSSLHDSFGQDEIPFIEHCTEWEWEWAWFCLEVYYGSAFIPDPKRLLREIKVLFT
jgi:hypothetical protein